MKKKFKRNLVKLIKKVLRPTFIGKYYQKKYSKENTVKNNFRMFYDGYYNGLLGVDVEPVVKFPLFRLGITRFDVKIKHNVLFLSIDCERVGIMIGKGGRDLDKLKEHLIKYCDVKDVVFDLNESKIWNYKRF